MKQRMTWMILSIICLVAVAVPASAQVFTGRIDVTVKDGTGAVLPGVTVQLTGVQAENAVTDSRGEAHFLNLAPGRYTVTATLTGFNAYKNENVPVSAGSVVPLDVTLAVGNVSEEVSVTAETPVIEAKRTAVATNVTLEELQNIPSSRDPWVVLQTVPGVMVDRVNVGGAESGQQSNYKAKGAQVNQNTWNMDGVTITDMAALGSSPTYYDFDMFQEMQVTTGGADVTTATPGVQLNFVLRSGTNQWRGSGSYYFENDGLQSDNISDDLIGELASYNRVNSYFDTGFEGGGPLWKDKLWVWGAYGRTEPKLKIFSFDGTDFVQTAKDDTVLKNTSFKVSGDINPATRGNFTYFRGDKQKEGRGAAFDRPDETTYNQAGPTDLYKFEVNRTVGSSLFLTGRFGYTKNEFAFDPRGGQDTTAFRDDSNIWHGTFNNYSTERPQTNFNVEGNYFRGNHEFKAGLGWRGASVDSSVSWPGGMYSLHNGYPFIEATVVRPWALSGNGTYWNGYFSDTISLDRLTFNLGVRWDRSASSIKETTVPANPIDPLLPALEAPAVDDVVVWNTLSPRVGVSYALGADRKTLLRASYAMFASQLDSNFAASVASAIPYYSYVYWSGTDTNGNQRLDPSEFTTFQGTYGFDPDNPLAGNPNRVGDYKTPKTHELLFGAEREIFPGFGLSGTVTWRKYVDFNWLHFRDVTGSDYELAGVTSGSAPGVGSFEVPFYAVNPAAVPDDFGRVYEHRPGYSQRYLGYEIVANKRMSNRWMMRASWAGGTHREYFDGLDSMADPTPSIPGTSQFTLGSPNLDGGLVLEQTSGSGKSAIFLSQPKYQMVLTGAYQAGWGINTAVNYVMRQGYAAPYYNSSTPGSADDISGVDKTVLLVSDVDENRLPTVHSFDARISKNFRFDRASVDFDVDFFNLFNNGTTLGRQFDVAADNVNDIIEIMNPRIVRFGIRISFN
ncbi:MAG TPA: TonB-dependent receptor [Vicinamibacterales bacterium]|nr:TonB-dependent receptor [Vicinamibacterales bacterium]